MLFTTKDNTTYFHKYNIYYINYRIKTSINERLSWKVLLPNIYELYLTDINDNAKTHC